MNAPVVSVILTAHNYGRFLRQSVQSVLGQTFQDFELILVDDGSTDNTPEIIAGYKADPRVTALTLPGLGLAAACNRGIRSSRGAYVMRLDADDYLDPHALAVEAGVLDRHPEIDLVYPDFYTVDEEGRFLGYTRVPRIQEGARLLDNNPLAGGALYRRTCFDALGGYNETLRYQEDFDFWLRFVERFRAFGVGLPLLSYRRHAGSMSRNYANRSAARRFVKRSHVEGRRLFDGEDVLIVIPGRWPGDPDRSETLLARRLGTTSVIGLAAGQVATGLEAARGVVVTDHPAAREAARSTDLPVASPPDAQSRSGERPELAWLRECLRRWSAAGQALPATVALVSPYCPLRHPERLREALDTLMIHDCDLVLSVDGEPVIPWQVVAQGLVQAAAPSEPGSIRVVREAGELLAVRTAWLMASPPMADPRTGYIELLYPEWWCVRDEASWKTCGTLLDAAAALRVQPSAYLRAEA